MVNVQPAKTLKISTSKILGYTVVSTGVSHMRDNSTVSVNV